MWGIGRAMGRGGPGDLRPVEQGREDRAAVTWRVWMAKIDGSIPRSHTCSRAPPPSHSPPDHFQKSPSLRTNFPYLLDCSICPVPHRFLFLPYFYALLMPRFMFPWSHKQCVSHSVSVISSVIFPFIIPSVIRFYIVLPLRTQLQNLNLLSFYDRFPHYQSASFV